MPDPDTFEELLAEIYGPRRELIKAFRFFDGRVNSKKLFDEADAPRGSKHHYLSTLEELDLISKVGTEHGGHGGQAFVWQLTARGEQVADEIADEDATTISDLEEIEERLTEVERRVGAEHDVDDEQVQANSAAIEDLRDDVDTILDRVEQLVTARNGH